MIVIFILICVRDCRTISYQMKRVWSDRITVLLMDAKIITNRIFQQWRCFEESRSYKKNDIYIIRKIQDPTGHRLCNETSLLPSYPLIRNKFHLDSFFPRNASLWNISREDALPITTILTSLYLWLAVIFHIYSNKPEVLNISSYRSYSNLIQYLYT